MLVRLLGHSSLFDRDTWCRTPLLRHLFFALSESACPDAEAHSEKWHVAKAPSLYHSEQDRFFARCRTCCTVHTAQTSCAAISCGRVLFAQAGGTGLSEGRVLRPPLRSTGIGIPVAPGERCTRFVQSVGFFESVVIAIAGEALEMGQHLCRHEGRNVATL